MKQFKYLFYLIFFIFPFGQLVGIPVEIKNINFNVQLLDILSFIVVIYWLFFIQNKPSLPKAVKPLLVFGLISLLSFAVKTPVKGLRELVLPFFYLIRLLIWIIFLWPAYDFIKKVKIKLKPLLIYEGLVIGLFSFFQYLFIPDTRFLKYSGWDDHLYRSVGSFLDPSFTGLFLVLSFIVGFDYFFLQNKYMGKTYWKYSYLLFLVVCISLTFSRMAYGLLFIYLFLILIKTKKIKILIVYIFLFLISLILIPKPTGEGVNLFRKSTFIAKSGNYSQIISIIKDNYFLGVGYNNLRQEYHKRGYLSENNWQISHSGSGADNSFLFVFSVTGILGLLPYLYYWLNILRLTFINKNFFVFSTVVCLLMSSFFINSLFYPWVFFWWGIVLADFMVGIEV